VHAKLSQKRLFCIMFTSITNNLEIIHYRFQTDHGARSETKVTGRTEQNRRRFKRSEGNGSERNGMEENGMEGKRRELERKESERNGRECKGMKRKLKGTARMNKSDVCVRV
jgi:hypothetical protein